MTVLASGVAYGSQVIPNWPAPATWSPPRTTGGVHTLTNIGNPAVFQGITPCRVADTRGNGFTGQYGPPSLVADANRNFTIGGQCGIPADAYAVSFNFTALNVGGAGDLRVFPQGGGLPLVSTLNYNANTPNVANAAVVTLGTSGGITVRADAIPVDLIIDVNGYYLNNNTNISDGEYIGFEGNGVGVGGLVFSYNASTSTSQGTSAFRGSMDGAGNAGAAVLGDQSAISGANFGVRGNGFSTTGHSAGVLGVSGARPTIASIVFPTGVRGESTGARNGVLGMIQDSGGGFGVAGVSLDTAGGLVRVGRLADAASGLGVSYTGGLGGSGTKNFYEPHPSDPKKVIRFVSLEGPEAGTYFRGRGRLEHGRAVIDVPEGFRLVTDAQGLTAQVTVMGRPTLIGVSSLDLNQVVVEGSRDVEFSYLVQGVRRAYNDFEAVVDHPFFQPRSPEDQMTASLSPDEKARLVANGTYNADGSVNMATAERLGWAQQWRDRARAEEERARAQAAAEARKDPNRP